MQDSCLRRNSFRVAQKMASRLAKQSQLKIKKVCALSRYWGCESVQLYTAGL